MAWAEAICPGGTGDHGGVEISMVPVGLVPDIEEIWTDLQERAENSFFLSWLWIESWLEVVPARQQPLLLLARDGGRIVGLGILCPNTIWRYGMLRKRCWFLHETGNPRIDRLTIEYNGLLAERDRASDIISACLRWLTQHGRQVDEVVLGGIDATVEQLARGAAEAAGQALRVRRTSLARGVDLAYLRSQGGEYRAGLGRNTRASVNRAIRLYRERGSLEYRVAETVKEGLAFFDALEDLHRKTWRARGQADAFDNPAFRPFHCRLIERGLPEGAVRLCRVSAGGEPIAYLYNFVWGGTVSNYQSGLAYEADNRLKPGMVAHVLAIEDALCRGESYYDFMAGQAEHKIRLSNRQQPLTWLAFGPHRLAARVEGGLSCLRRYGRRWILSRIRGS